MVALLLLHRSVLLALLLPMQSPPPSLSLGTTALYLFLFSVHYFVYKTTITGGLSYLLYFGYTFIMVFLFMILTGEVACCYMHSHTLSLMREGGYAR